MSTLIFDADDTLWENNIYFERAFDQFVDFLDHSHLTPPQIRDVLNEIELVNAKIHGYGSINFGRNLQQAYQHLVQREIGLAVGEPPATRGYPPSVFALLPRLLERSGPGETGSITALYTVLAEGDDLADPVADAARAALDGHIVLSRKLAESGHFPAIDVLASVSRVMTDIAQKPHLGLAQQVREVMSTYRESSDLIELGAYVAGSSPRIDRALKCRPGLLSFLRQDPAERFTLEQALEQLQKALSQNREAPRA